MGCREFKRNPGILRYFEFCQGEDNEEWIDHVRHSVGAGDFRRKRER